MLSLEQRASQTIADLIKDSAVKIFPNGDVLYTSSRFSDFDFPYLRIQPEPFQLLVRIQAINIYPKLTRLLELDGPRPFQNTYQGLRGFVTKENAGGIFNRKPVAVKRVHPAVLDTTGIEQFKVLRSLEEEGVLCAAPIAATRWRFISKWIDGQPGYEVSETILDEYLEVLDKVAEKLKDEGKWDKEWRVERQPANYIVSDLSAENPLERFIVVDPVSIRSMIII